MERILGIRPDCITVRNGAEFCGFENNTGCMELRIYHVFDGVHLVFRDAHMLKYTAPAAEKKMIEISYCHEGRFEQHMDKQFYYLSKGDLSVSHTYSVPSEIYFPTSHYHGVSVLIDPEAAPAAVSSILPGSDEDIEKMILRFSSCGDCFIFRSDERLKHIFSELFTVPEKIRSSYFKVKVLELILFLCSTDIDPAEEPPAGCSRSQAALAKKVCSYVCGNMSVHFTIDQLSEHFGVSPTHLKKSFRSVYGDSLYAYVRTQKMLAAAKMLRDTDRTILDIAGEFGYDNGSKFSKAFRSVMGASPSEFRRNKSFPIESIRLERKNDF